MMSFIFPRSMAGKVLLGLMSTVFSLRPPKEPADLVVTIEAEDKLDFQSRLAEITPPTLVIAGANDPFYSESLFRETAEGIPHSQLIVYPDMGHQAEGKQFASDLLEFLRKEPLAGD
jgi:pimeloyl-ACP methyl ester carboxylesterase